VTQRNIFKKHPNQVQTATPGQIESAAKWYNIFNAVRANRYKWIGLPDDLDKYIELILNGALVGFGGAVIGSGWCGSCAMWYDDAAGVYRTLPTLAEEYGIYGQPIKGRAIGYKGTNFNVDDSFAVFGRNTRDYTSERATLQPMIMQLCELDRSIDVAIARSRIPILVVAPDGSELDAMDLVKRQKGGEPIVVVNKGNFEGVEFQSIDLTPGGSGELGVEEMMDAQNQIFARALNVLGVDHVTTDKKERLLAAEVAGGKSLVEITKMNTIGARREFARAINEKFGLNVEVIENSDAESDAWAFKNDPIVASEASRGATL